jgi:hypothetical protein
LPSIFSTVIFASNTQDINLKFGVELEFFVKAVDPGRKDINQPLSRERERATLRIIHDKLRKQGADNVWRQLVHEGKNVDYSQQWIVKREGDERTPLEADGAS